MDTFDDEVGAPAEAVDATLRNLLYCRRIQYLDMPKVKPFARIAITLPARDLAAADRLAVCHDRSRSWIVAEAIRRYAADEAASAVPPTQQGLGESRRAQL